MDLDPRDAAIHRVCVNDPRSGKSPPKDTRGISFTMILHYNLVQSAAHAGRRQLLSGNKSNTVAAAAAAADSEEPRRSCCSTVS